MDSDTRQDKSIEILQKQANYYYETQIPVCIWFIGGKYKHGIIKKVLADFFIFEDRYDGDDPVFFAQIDRMEKSKQEWKG